ncbi:glycosyltransferase [bacterium]|nr:glycosyltransferase [bacterium]
MEKNPKLSIIVPIYGVEKYLEECLDSIINQTFKDMEIILIDDGGKDNCPQIIDDYAKKDSRIIAIHKENGGYGNTCNRGLECAMGEYIAIVEPDDFIDKNMYEDLYKLAKDNNADIVKSAFNKFIDTDLIQEIKKVNWYKEKNPPTGIFTIKDYAEFLYFHPSIWSCIYKREFLNSNNIRFIEAPGAGWTDNPFQVQTMCLAQRIIYTDEAYYNWRCINKNQSDDLKDYTLPFKRSDEIHRWLGTNNIKDKQILEALYRRELAYIHIVMGMKNISDKNDCYDQIKQMCKRMDKEIVKNSNNIGIKDKNFYKRCCINPKIAQIGVKIRRFRKRIISINWNRHKKLIRLFGKEIIKG